MRFEDFTSRKWIVSGAGVTAKCTSGERIIIAGTPKEVILLCGSRDKGYREPYSQGKYLGDSNTIEMDNEYVLSISWTPKPQISFSPLGVGSEGGSWTADDNIVDPGDDQS
jgi:hypothetical protein